MAAIALIAPTVFLAIALNGRSLERRLSRQLERRLREQSLPKGWKRERGGKGRGVGKGTGNVFKMSPMDV